METRDLLIEIGTEELPPKALEALSDAFRLHFEYSLAQMYRKGEIGLAGTLKIEQFATPRRLGLLVRNVPIHQPDRRIEKRGPAISVAYDAAGKPSKAALGFARSCGVDINELQTLETEKGAWLAYITIEPGAPTAEALPNLLRDILGKLPIPKTMRWGASEEAFVRPVHWIVLLFGDKTIDAEIMGVKTGRTTYGHRFHCPMPLMIERPDQYEELLKTTGSVIPSFHERQTKILEQIKSATKELGGHPQDEKIYKDLLKEVTALVEWPVPIIGSFDERFLEVPAEALVATLQGNQKCFPVRDTDDRLMPFFIAIANIQSHDPVQVRKGYERVIRPRFSDAEFFWNQDRKQALIERLQKLKSVVFQQRLGTLYDKSARTADLAKFVARQIDLDPKRAEKAAWLSKCDLLTEMVQEFPELQGIMGRYYALHDGEPEEIALAQEEQYRPRFAGDAIPVTKTGSTLAIADRLDTLIGIFAIGQAPSGAKDPFALRRAALGVLRIMIEGSLDLDLQELLEHNAGCFDPALEAEAAVTPVFDFILERLRSYYLEQGFRPDEFEAVLEQRPTRILDFDRRLRAVAEFRRLPEAESLAAANKRIRNILKKVNYALPAAVHSDLLEHKAERALANHLEALSTEVTPLLEQGHYREALTRLAALREPVDRFFDQVMVMADDPALRDNRLALLNRMSGLFFRVADLSRLQT